MTLDPYFPILVAIGAGFLAVLPFLVAHYRADLCAHPIPETCPNCRDAE